MQRKLVLNWLARRTWYHTPKKWDGKCHFSSGWWKHCVDYFKQNKRLQYGCQSCAQQKPHDTRNGEDTKGTLQILLLCTIKHVVFIVDISNTLVLAFFQKKKKKKRISGLYWLYMKRTGGLRVLLHNKKWVLLLLKGLNKKYWINWHLLWCKSAPKWPIWHKQEFFRKSSSILLIYLLSYCIIYAKFEEND